MHRNRNYHFRISQPQCGATGYNYELELGCTSRGSPLHSTLDLLSGLPPGTSVASSSYAYALACRNQGPLDDGVGKEGGKEKTVWAPASIRPPSPRVSSPYPDERRRVQTAESPSLAAQSSRESRRSSARWEIGNEHGGTRTPEAVD